MISTHVQRTGAATRAATQRRLSAVGAALAVTGLAVAGLLAPVDAAPAAAATGASVADLTPPPQEARGEGVPIDLTGAVTIVAAADVDAVALAALEVLIETAGGTPVVATAPAEGVTIHLGTDEPALTAALTAIEGPSLTDLPAEGYVLASGTADGRPTLVLAGADGTGTYYAVQSLRQLITDGIAAPMRVRDFPLMSIRGTIEGFYGTPWSHEARMDLLAYSGEHKLNTYIYTPKDDLLLRSKWRELYAGDDLAGIAELVQQANEHHVQFTFALSPGNSICYSSQEDFDATIAKFDQLRDLGVQSFYIALDDIGTNSNNRCQADKDLYPNTGNWHWLADSQADYLNRIQTEYIEPNGLRDLQTVPTNYSGSGEDPYKAEFGTRLNDDIRIQWTGEGVFSDTITVDSVQQAATSYRTDHLYIWDNFPVNDGRRDRLFLNPLTGRDAELYRYIDGFTSNPMIEPYASWPALANYADYTWNGPAYDPDASMAAALRELAGADPTVQEALTAFADLNQSWPYRGAVVYAPALGADIDAYDAGDEQPLRDRLALIAAAPQILAGMAEPGFYADSEPWIDAAAHWATALDHELDLLTALESDYGVTAADAFLAARAQVALAHAKTVDDTGGDGVLHEDVIVPTVGDGRFDTFDADAMATFTDWLGAVPNAAVSGYPASATSSMGAYGSNVTDNMTDGDPATMYWSNAAPAAGDHVQLDLGREREIGSIHIQQGGDDGDTTGDLIYDATVQYSLDGTTWTDAGTFSDSPVIDVEFDEPVTARYVRLVAAGGSGKWVKIREFAALPIADRYPSTASTSMGTYQDEVAANMTDGDVSTKYWSDQAPAAGDHVQVDLGQEREIGSIHIQQGGDDGDTTGDLIYDATVQYSLDGTTWTDAGTFSDSPVIDVEFDEPVTARYVRLVAAGG
ncbi:carbohydrate-binding protein, partial [Pseudactinotalea sp. HY160]|uniref:beta-N-acetylglucosaminidase domain-containing protein n=1 Tax=Pseudactinotalea sp. HY160 TaxID=2654490 RepID=UPI00128BB1E6|nr:carbohydrate-binding protein [Pseudactinotalea sp. HY160]